MGLSFSAGIEDESISLVRKSCPVGTKIRIEIPARLRSEIRKVIPAAHKDKVTFSDSLGHYFLQRPSLLRLVGEQPYPVEWWLPQPDDDMDAIWRSFSPAGFEKVFWTYERTAPELAVNGIVVQSGIPWRYETQWEYIETPRLSVFDRDGLLPINLERTSLQGGVPFGKDLEKSIGEDIFAYALLEAPEDVGSAWYAGEYIGFGTASRPYYYGGYGSWDKWMLSRDGFLLNEPSTIKAFAPRHIVVVVGGERRDCDALRKIRKVVDEKTLVTFVGEGCFSDASHRIKGEFRHVMEGRAVLPAWLVSRSTICVPECIIEKIEKRRPGKEIRKNLAPFIGVESVNRWKVIGDLGYGDKIVRAVTALEVGEASPFIVCILQIDGIELEGDEPVAMNGPWRELCPNGLMPFQLADRKVVEDRLPSHLSRILSLRRDAQKAMKKSKCGRRGEVATDDDEEE